MHSMHPVIVFGSYRWDQDLLPLDEFEERLRAVRMVMRREGCCALVVHGDPQDSTLLTWLTNAYPRLRWNLALIGLEGEPELLAAGATRDLPAASALTWCRSFQSYGDAPRLMADWRKRVEAAAEPGTPPRIAVHGLQRMRSAVRGLVREALGTSLVATGESLDGLNCTKRWRELRVLREAHGLLSQTVAALREAWSAGSPIKSAVLEAERVARRAQAQDVRILFSLDGGATLQPFESMSQERTTRLVCWVAVRYLGYWASCFICEGPQQSEAHRLAAQALQALVSAAGPGVDGAALAAALPPVASGFRPHPMLEGVLAHGTGLQVSEAPLFTSGSQEPMREGGVYSLRSGYIDANDEGALLSSTVCIVDGKTEILFYAR